MRILISNDDGIQAEGLALLERAALRLTGDVWVVAPDGNRSGYGHGISLRRSMTVSRQGERRYACSGTPADCVIAALSWLFHGEKQPDLVLSGINEGRNVAQDVAYSGTMAVAREAAMSHIAAMSFSQPRDCLRQPGDDSWLASCLHTWWEQRTDWAGEGHWLNINLPRILPAPLRLAQIGDDKIATQVLVHEALGKERAVLEPSAQRSYHAVAGDENAWLDSGVGTITRLHWRGHSGVSAGLERSMSVEA